MNKKIYLILFLSIAVFLGLIALFAVFNLSKPKIAGPSLLVPVATSSKAVVPGKLEGGSVLADSKAKKDPAQCLKITDERYAEACIDLVAQDMRDENACSVIKDAAKAVDCTDGAFFTKALDSGDAAICQNIKNTATGESCVANVIKKAGLKESDCQRLPEKEKNYCLNYFRYENDTVAYYKASSAADCQNISNESTKVVCLAKFQN